MLHTLVKFDKILVVSFASFHRVAKYTFNILVCTRDTFKADFILSRIEMQVSLKFAQDKFARNKIRILAFRFTKPYVF